jgi:hypothetical protein
MFCIVWLYLYCCWRYNYQEKYDWCLINQFNHATIGVLVTSLLFPSTIVVVIFLLTMINYLFKKCLKISKR